MCLSWVASVTRSFGELGQNGHSCLKSVVGSVKLDRPDLVTSTYLRKYIATVSQLLDVKPNEFELLCRHMGHSSFVHRDYYRLPSRTLELAKLSKLLLAVENGDLNEICGKTLNDTDVHLQNDVELDVPQQSDDTDGETDATDVEPDSDLDVDIVDMKTISSDCDTANSAEISSQKVSHHSCSLQKKKLEQNDENSTDVALGDSAACSSRKMSHHPRRM